MGPNYVNLFVGFVVKQIFKLYPDRKPDYFVGTLMTVMVQHHVLVSNWNGLLTLLMISTEPSNSHGGSVKSMFFLNCSVAIFTAKLQKKRTARLTMAKSL